MKKILYAVLATVSGLVLLFSYKTSLEVVTPTAAADTSTNTSGSGARTGTSGAGSTTVATGLRDGSYTGDAVGTRYGPVQAKITVSGGMITAVDVPEYPNGNGRDRQINERAIPRLISETLQSQDASIDMVSGATYTSEGYTRSLQSAIDQAQP
jgi:uncharacterized protein with FMN-binding domain